MPAPVLTMAATIMCPHGGTATAVPQNQSILIMGAPVLVMTDVFIIAGCAFVIAGVPAPCLTIQWSMPAVSMVVHGTPVLLATSIGLCMGGSGGLPAVVIPGQTQVVAS